VSEVVGEGVIHIRTDDSGVDVQGAGATAGKGYTKGFLGSLKGLAVGIGSVLAAREVIGFAKEALAEGREAQKVGATTEQIIKSTGQAAGVTAEQVSDMAGRLSGFTGIDDEAIQSGTNLLLTFKNVKDYVDGQFVGTLDRATALSLDLSAAGFGSIESASKGLGKALNDPLKGISALGRAGVTFTEAQKEQIKALVESGDLLSAQNIILDEVEGQVGGVAEATATSSQKAQVAWDNLKEQIGTALIPIVDSLADTFATKVVPALSGVIDGTNEGGKVIRQVAGFIGDAIDLLQGALDSGEGAGIIDKIADAAQTALPVVLDVFDRLVDAGQEFAEEVLPIIADTFLNDVLPAITSLVSYVAANLLPILGDVADIIINQVVPTFADIVALLYGTVYPAIIAIVTAVAENLKPVFDQLVETFRNDVLPTLASLIESIRNDLLPVLQPIIEKVLAVVGAVLKLAAAILGKVLPPVIQFVGFLVRNLIPILVQVIVFVLRFVNAILDIGAGIGRAIGSFVGFVKRLAEFQLQVIGFIADIPGKVLGLVKQMRDAGKDFMGGLFDGIISAAGKAGGVVADIAEDVFGAVKGLINDAIDLLNEGIPNSIGKGPLTIDLPNNPIPHLARGTDSWPGGWSWVGEEGPELVNVPRGAQVVPAGRSAAMAAAPASGAGMHVEKMVIMPHNYSEFVRQTEAESRVAALGSRRPGGVRPVFGT